MAAKVETSKLVGMIQGRAKGAFNRVKNNAPKAKGGGGLPGGIKGAVARFHSCKLDKTQDKGNPYATLTGIVVHPPEFKGRRASTSHYFEDTTHRENGKTVEQIIDEFLNDVKLMGIDISECGELKDVFDLLESISQDKDTSYFYKFDTWQGRATEKYPNPKVYVQIQEPTDFTEESTEEEVVDDANAETDEQPSKPKPKSKPAAKPPVAQEEEPEDQTTEEEEVEEETDEGTDEEEDWAPKPGDHYFYKDGKLKKAIYKVTTVNTSKQTVTIVKKDNPNAGKEIKNVAWDLLLSE